LVDSTSESTPSNKPILGCNKELAAKQFESVFSLTAGTASKNVVGLLFRSSTIPFVTA
jgi:hypothetical protein